MSLYKLCGELRWSPKNTCVNESVHRKVEFFWCRSFVCVCLRRGTLFFMSTIYSMLNSDLVVLNVNALIVKKTDFVYDCFFSVSFNSTQSPVQMNVLPMHRSYIKFFVTFTRAHHDIAAPNWFNGSKFFYFVWFCW